jgi:hypothetical protein
MPKMLCGVLKLLDDSKTKNQKPKPKTKNQKPKTKNQKPKTKTPKPQNPKTPSVFNDQFIINNLTIKCWPKF